jgi:hypothetical protein
MTKKGGGYENDERTRGARRPGDSDESRCEVDLATGEEAGNVHLTRSNDTSDKGRWYECNRAVVGTGLTPEGNPTFDYGSSCTRRGR